ncbi:MAG: PAS domain-containing sensor histidine kinase, partial [Myxococcales bacterium]|nr:PAS domain-containing sensor histidine kinase [Myxococcales bacterium]
VKPLLYGHADRSPVAPGTWECSYERSDGSQLILGFKASPLRTDQGDEIGKILIIDDLTHIRAMEERMRRDERLATVGRLAAGIAHEIRNPLASISGSIQVLQSMGEAGEEESRLMEIAVRETDRLNGLLTDFLQYVRQVPLQRGPIDLGSLIRETLSAIKRDPRAHEGV